MIAYLKGRVLYQTEETVVLEVNGVGYEVYCSGEVFKRANEGEIAVYTHLQVKEDGVTLFGFIDQREKDLFMKLTSVSGVGPKLGISVLSTLSADELSTAILSADVKKLSRVKGLGKKTAEKMILELHGKISAAELLSADETKPASPSEQVGKLSPEDEDAVSALLGLGFTRNESVQAVKKAKEAGANGVEEIIVRALKGF